jgi:hypothetical protein
LIIHHLQAPLVGFTIPADTQAFRIQTLAALMESGIPPTALEGPNGEKSRLRVLLEMSGFELCGPRGLADFIPVVRCSEVEVVKAQLHPNPLDKKHCVPVSHMFDGSGLSESAEAVVLRFLDQSNPAKWVLRQPLASLQFLKNSPTGLGLAGSINATLQTRYGIPPGAVVAGTRDRAATNGVAMETLSAFYPAMDDMCCNPHTINNVHTISFSRRSRRRRKGDEERKRRRRMRRSALFSGRAQA